MTKQKPKLPDFESVLLVMEQIERPQCVFPEFGLNGQQLWGSQPGITSGRVGIASITGQRIIKGDPVKASSISKTLRVAHEGKSEF